MRTAHAITVRDTWESSHASFAVEKIRKDFPILGQWVRGKPLIYLDNAATSQKPQVVIDTLNRYYAADNANVHRGIHFLSEQATQAYEGARDMAREIARSWEGRTSRRLRKKIEMLFAHLKRILKLDRLRLRGPNGAHDEFILAATAQNLRKLAKLIPMPKLGPA